MRRFPTPFARRPFAALILSLIAASAYATPVSLDLPAQSLEDAIKQLSAASGLSIVVDAAKIAGRITVAVKGTMEPREALDRLLEGSDLIAKYEGAQAIIVRRTDETRLKEVQVLGIAMNADGSTPESGGMYVPNQTFGPLGVLPTKEIPFSTTSIPRTVIDDQQARTLFDMARNDPSVTPLYGPNANNAEALNIRGWTLDFSMGYRMNGGAISFQGAIAPELLERVDIYKGLDGFLYGFVTPGGVLNYITKKPLEDSLTRYTQSFSNRSALGEAIDISRRFGQEGQVGIRVNLATENGDQALQYQHIDRNVLGLAADWKINSQAKLWVNLAHIDSNLRAPQPAFDPDTAAFVAAGQKYILTPDASRNYGQSWFFNKRTSDDGSIGIDWENQGWVLHGSMTKSTSRESKQNIFGYTLEPDGSLSGTALLTTPDAPDDFHGYDFLLSRTFELGAVEHQASLAATSTTQTGNYVWGNTSEGDINSSIYNPIQVLDSGIPSKLRFPFVRHIYFDNAILSDNIKFSESFRIIAGIAYPKVKEDLHFIADSKYSGAKTAPQIAAVVSPTKDISIYGSYVESYQAGGYVNDAGADNYGSLLPPYISSQFEIGLKSSPIPGLEVNAAIFRMKMPSQVNQPDGAGGYSVTQNGQQTNQGIELSAIGKPVRSLSVMGGLMYLDSKYADPSTSASLVAGTPHITARLFAEYETNWLPGLSMTGGLFHTGEVASIPNQLYYSGHTTVDLGGKFITKVGIAAATVRLYVSNALNKSYWAGPGYLGEPRAVRASAQFEF